MTAVRSQVAEAHADKNVIRSLTSVSPCVRACRVQAFREDAACFLSAAVVGQNCPSPLAQAIGKHNHLEQMKRQKEVRG